VSASVDEADGRWGEGVGRGQHKVGNCYHRASDCDTGINGGNKEDDRSGGEFFEGSEQLEEKLAVKRTAVRERVNNMEEMSVRRIG
jgi:hypothetical protein